MKSKHAPETDVERLEAVKQIWPNVEEANQIAPGFAKIPKSLILFTRPEKPVLRSGKDTVQRQLTVKSYSKELDQLFLSQQNYLLIEGLTLDGSSTQDNIRIFTRQIYGQVMELDNLSDSDDVFHRGMDSLKVLVVVQRFRAAVTTVGLPIKPKDVDSR
jgi:aryl carrier-like protein